MKFENIHVYNFEGAFRGMRNPKNSWNRSDSYFGISSEYRTEVFDIVYNWVKEKYPQYLEAEPTQEENEEQRKYLNWLFDNGVLEEGPESDFVAAFLGPKDLKLAQQLIKAGPEHRKFLRQIFVSVDITAPLYFYKEFDTYKVSTVANSTSTMHKLASTPITLDCFEISDYNPMDCTIGDNSYNFVEGILIPYLENLRLAYNETKDKRYWKELIRWLPESWLQTRTWTCSYETLLSIYNQRKNHKLTEWSVDFMNFIKSLPYANELLLFDFEK